MNPSPSAIAAIRLRITDWTPTDATIVATLNTPAIANPVSVAPQVPKPFTFGDVFALLSDTSIAAIRDTPNTTDLISNVNDGDRLGVIHWVAALGKSPAKITSSEAAAVYGLMTATIADPAWATQISWAMANIGRPVDAFDIAASRP